MKVKNGSFEHDLLQADEHWAKHIETFARSLVRNDLETADQSLPRL